MKKVLSLLVLSVFVLTAILSGCGSGTTQSSAPAAKEASTAAAAATTAAETAKPAAPKNQELNYWYPWGGDSEKWDKWRIGEFEKANSGYKVNATYVPPDGGISNGKLLAAIAGGNPPDLVVTSDAASGYALSTQGALEPIGTYLDRVGLKESDIIQSFLPLMKYKGQTYIMPMDSNVNLLYYNVAMFKEAGLDPDNPPKTIEELDKYAEKLNKINGSKIERLGFIPWIDAGDDSYLWGWIFGCNFFNTDTGKVEISGQPLVNLYKWMNSYAKKYNPEKIKSFTSGFGGAFSPDHAFFTGKIAMTVNGNWFSNALRLYAPKVEYKVAPIPAPQGGREKATTYGTNIFLVPKGAKNIEAAALFMKFAEDPAISADNINTWRSITILKTGWDKIKLVQDGDAVYKIVREIAESPNSGHAALTKVAKQMGNDLKAIRDNVIYNNKDPQPLLTDEEKKLQAEVDKK